MSSFKVLIVEDEAGLRSIYERILRDLADDILLAKDGGEAIDILSHESPDLVFLDMLLPVVNGRGVLEYISQEQPRLLHMHVVVASSAKEYARFLDIVPSAEFLLKPILPAQIREVAQRLSAIRG